MLIMKRSIRLRATVAAVGLFCISLSFPSPASASIPCEAGTVNNFPDGSLESCVLRVDVNAALNKNVYPCKGGEYISFAFSSFPEVDGYRHFRSCVLSTPLKVRTGNEVVTCLPDSWVSVSISYNGDQSVSCGATASINHWWEASPLPWFYQCCNCLTHRPNGLWYHLSPLLVNCSIQLYSLEFRLSSKKWPNSAEFIKHKLQAMKIFEIKQTFVALSVA